LVDWRLAEYLGRTHSGLSSEDGFVARVSQSAGRPIVFLPDRTRNPSIPMGTVRLQANGHGYEADFVKVALNVVREPSGSQNQLPEILQTWFGQEAGQPGTSHRVRFQREQGAWAMSAVDVGERSPGPELWRHYMREEIPPLFGLPFNTAIWNAGFVKQSGHLFLLVTLDKEDMPSDFKYEDSFVSPDRFQWHSQNRTTQKSMHGQDLSGHAKRSLTVHLFVRRTKKVGQKAAPFVYCGPVDFIDWDGDAPITIRWRLKDHVPSHLHRSLKVPNESA
jgi:hypothetical protein